MESNRDDKGRFAKGCEHSEDMLRKTSITWFKKGHKPSEDMLRKMSITWFKKGHKSSHAIKGWINKGSFKEGHEVPNEWREKVAKASTTFPIGKNKLEELYLDKKLSPTQIGEAIGVHGTSVLRWVKRFDIPNRNRVEARKLMVITWGDKISKGKMGHSVSKETREKLRIARMIQEIPSSFTKPELKLIDILRKHKIPLEYTGNGSFWISGLNPDFVDKERKIIVEVFGRYWHTPKEGVDVPFYRTYNGRKFIFMSKGWTTIIFWEDEINEDEVLKRLSVYYPTKEVENEEECRLRPRIL